MQRLVIQLLTGIIGLYRRLPRLRPPVCRYDPSCSEYAVDALEIHGVFRGLGMAAKRLARCHPWGSSGWDPVPSADASCTHASPSRSHPATSGRKAHL